MTTQLQRIVAFSRIHQPVVYTSELLKYDFPFLVANGLAPWCFSQLKKNDSPDTAPEVLALFRKSYMANMVRNNHLLQVYKLMVDAFAAHRIPMRALKGIALAHTVYPDNALRPMGDIDIWVPEGRGLHAIKLLSQLGATEAVVPRSNLHEQTAAHMRAMRLNGVLVEVHQRLFAMGNKWNIKLPESLADECFNLGGVAPLPHDLFGYHLAAHACYGLQLGGMRLAWLLDLALLVDRQSDPGAFVARIIDFNSANRHQVANLMEWVNLFRDPDAQWPQSFPPVNQFHQPEQVKNTHRWVNFNDIVHTPGIGRKCRLFFRELFPCNEYMRFRYGQTGVAAHLRRLRFKT